VCKESAVVHYLCHPVRNFWDGIFCFTPLERGAQNGSFKWLNHPELPKITELQGIQVSTDLKICYIKAVFAK